MRRALNFRALPALACLLAAQYCAIAAALLLAWHGEAALAPHRTPITSAMLFLIALDFLVAAIAGAMIWLRAPSWRATARRCLARRRAAIAGTRFWQLSITCLLLAALLHVMPLQRLGVDAAVRPLLLAVLAIVGCAVSAMSGMLYRIVPFLGADRARRQWRWHLAGLLLLAPAPLAPGVLARPAGLFLLVSMLLLVRDLGRATVLYVRLRPAWDKAKRTTVL